MEEYYDKLLALLFTGDPNNIDLARLIISQIPTKRKKKEMCDKLIEGYLNLFKCNMYDSTEVWRTVIPSYFNYYNEKTKLWRYTSVNIYITNNDNIDQQSKDFNIIFMQLSKFLYCYKPKQED